MTSILNFQEMKKIDLFHYWGTLKKRDSILD